MLLREQSALQLVQSNWPSCQVEVITAVVTRSEVKNDSASLPLVIDYTLCCGSHILLSLFGLSCYVDTVL